MATPSNPRKQENIHEPTLLLAFELGLKTWKPGFARDFRDKPWLREMAGGDQDALGHRIATSACAREPRLAKTLPCTRATRAGTGSRSSTLATVPANTFTVRCSHAPACMTCTPDRRR